MNTLDRTLEIFGAREPGEAMVAEAQRKLDALVAGRVVQPEIGAEVDERNAPGNDLRRDRLAVAVRQRGEDEAGAVQRCGLKPLDPRAGIGQSEVRMHVGQRRAGLAVAEQSGGV